MSLARGGVVLNRREALGALIYPAAAAMLGGRAPSSRAAAAIAAAANLAPPQASPDEVARDEAFWFNVQQAFTVDRGIINLNNGGVSPSPAIVQQAMKRHLDHANTCPAHVLWKIQEPQCLAVCAQLARAFGAGEDEIAITRNASESLQICQFGIDLKPGDEILTTTQDYPRMITAFKQRQSRESIVLKQFNVPVPLKHPDDVVAGFESNITPKTKLILMCHVINLTGQILPVKQVVAMARAKGIPVIVDGAHALAHFDFKISDLDCDYYGVSLHKWLFAPHGTGLLYVRRDRIKGLWPLMAAEEKLADSIRKFEQIGTHPVAGYLAIAEAITFHQTIGPRNKQARLIYLRDYWLDRLRKHDRVRVHTNIGPGIACGIATIEIDGVDSTKLIEHLWDKHRILTTAIVHDEFQGVRVSPSVYTTLHELDRFVDAMDTISREGLPASTSP
jgi:isopenicillin-N epimerase